MKRWLVIMLWCVGCTASTPHGPDSASDEVDQDAVAVSDLRPDDDDTTMPGALVFALGERSGPFAPWAAGADVLVIQGPQGGYHTEHAVQVDGASVAELHLAIIRGEVWRDGLILARAGWEFWGEQWERADAGFRVELPALIFDDNPALGPAELRSSLELTDGRESTFDAAINLVSVP